jgi:tripartite-type tricarboxylate transporter receptor subunit TctC
MGPPNMTKAEIKYWDTIIEKMVSTDKWQQTLQKYMWNDFYKNSRETSIYLQEQSKMVVRLPNTRPSEKSHLIWGIATDTNST